MGRILGSRSHPKIDQKINQILDRFWKDFGSHFGSILGQFWLHKSIKNQGRFLKEKTSWIMWLKAGSPRYRAGLREGLIITELRQRHLKVYLTRREKHQRCCGGFWECFEDPGPSKMELSCRRGAIFEKITFFKPDAVMD